MKEHPLLSSVSHMGVRLGLDRMRRFLARVGSPHLSFPVIHVGGTNGKGSVATMIAAVLRAQGFRVGTYTSPHMQEFNERIRLDGRNIPDDALAELLDEISALRDILREDAGPSQDLEPFTYFELATILAFLYFSRQKVDIAVVEVGLGGRLDATNVVEPLVSVITSVALDHTEVLGPDVASIAGEKAGILKPRRPVVVGLLPADALRVVRAIASERACPLLIAGDDFSMTLDETLATYQGPSGVIDDIRVGMPGQHQIENAAVAIAALGYLPPSFPVSEGAIREGIAMARIEGRLEWLGPRLLVDCAHNPEAATSLARYLGEQSSDGTCTLLLGCSREKDIRTVAAILAPHVHRIITTSCSHPRALDAESVARELQGLCVPVEVGGPIEQALPKALESGDRLVVSGSIFLVGAVRDLVGTRT